MYHKNIPYRRRAQAKYKKKLETIANKMCYSPSGAYKVEKDGKYGLIDLGGNKLLDCEYESGINPS